MEKDDLKKKIEEDEDFIKSPRFYNSLKKMLAKNDRTFDNGSIGRFLLISPEEVERIYQESVLKLREGMTGYDYEEEDFD